MYICVCNAVTERDINQCLNRGGCCSMEDLQRETGVATGCGCCRETAQAMLAGQSLQAGSGAPL